MSRRVTPAGMLAALEQLHRSYGPDLADRKLALLESLGRSSLVTAGAVERLHEVLCFLRAYPDDRRVLAVVRALLDTFARRADLRRHADELIDTGIAGTDIFYRFFWPTADWLARRWPRQLSFDRADPDAADRIAATLPGLLEPVAAEWLRAARPDGFSAVDQLRPRGATDAAWFLGLVAAMPGNEFTRESFADAIDATFQLHAGRNTPSRTRAVARGAPRAFQRGPLRTARPDLRAEIRHPPRSVLDLPASRGAALIDLARGAMVTRARDLAAFQFADPADVFLVDDGAGLAFALMGTRPRRRALLPATFAALTLRNEVPLGYVQVDVLGATAAISFNTFETYRGAEAAAIFGRLLATVHHVFGCTAFSIEPYQLGQGNHEGIESGAWWFYYKLGFRPRARQAVMLARRELARMQRSPGHRSSPATLGRLAAFHVFFDVDPRAATPLPPVPTWYERAAAQLTRYATVDAGERRAAVIAAAQRRLGLRNLADWNADEVATFERWSPLVLALPGVSRWRPAERRQLVAVIRAKAARSERRYNAQLVGHERLRALLMR